MNDFLLTFAVCWVYARRTNAKSLDGFSSLLVERIPPLSGFFVSVIYLPFCFGWVFWGALGLAGLNSGLLTRFIRPPVPGMGSGFPNRRQRSMNHDSKIQS